MPLEKNAGIFARDTGAKYFLKGLRKSNQSSKHLSQKVVMKVRFFTLLLLELNYPVKITPKQCIIRVPICSRYVKIIFDFEIDLLT